jgi:hypothetical protein
MGTSALKSVPITNLDTIPAIPNTTGEGSPGYIREVGGFVTTVAADAAGSTYRLARIPSNSKVKHVFLTSEAQGAGAVQIGVYYSDSTIDGTAPANQGLVVPTTGVNFFANDVSVAAAVLSVDEVFQNQATAGANNLSLVNQPLWQALGLASDPGGYLDIVATVHTTAITTGGGRLGVAVQYVD